MRDGKEGDIYVRIGGGGNYIFLSLFPFGVLSLGLFFPEKENESEHLPLYSNFSLLGFPPIIFFLSHFIFYFSRGIIVTYKFTLKEWKYEDMCHEKRGRVALEISSDLQNNICLLGTSHYPYRESFLFLLLQLLL